MADNFGGNENIYFTDDQNIVLVDPNSIFDSNGLKKDRNIKQENLVMYANLEAQAVPRTRLAVGQGVESGVNNVQIAEINFLKPKDKDYFDTSYTEQLTGGRNSQGGTLNQIQFDGAQNPQQVNFVDTQLLGIRAISVDIKYNGIPEVNMVLVDVQGKSLFETGGNSPYSVFLYYPYPMFRLTLKGYYGKAIQYELMLLNFNANFDAGTGNFIVDLKFIARTSAILDDVRLGYLFALPNMYPNYSTQQVGQNVTSQNATATVQQTDVGNTEESIIDKSSKGYSKLKEVFDLYKANNLIDENVPVLTLNEMNINLKRYTQFLNEEFEQLDFTNIVALSRYQESLKRFNSEVLKWRTNYTDSRDILVLKNGLTLYGLNNIEIVTNDGNGQTNTSSNIDRKRVADAELTGITNTYVKELKSVPTWGSQIEFSGDPKNIQTFTEKFTIDDIDYIETYYKQEGVRVTSPLTDGRFLSFKDSLISTLQRKGTLITIDKNEVVQTEDNFYYYTFDRFNGDVKNLNGVIEQKGQEENERLNRQLTDRIKNRGNVRNLTFRPTVRNVTGVIMASVDAFYRLMTDVHKNSWEQRQNPYRLKSILRNTPSQEGVNLIESTNTNLSKIVYPWPQFVQKSESNEKTEYEVTYPGSRIVSNFTKATDPRIWPEVEFVEEYLRAAATTGELYDSSVKSNAKITLNYTTTSATEIEYQDNIYSNTNVPEFMYEFYERLYLNAFYSGLYYANTNEDLVYVGSQIELNNIIGKNLPYGPLRDVLVNVLPTTTLYDYLETTSDGGVGPLWNNFTQQNFNTPYIADRITNTFKVYSTSQYSKISKKPVKLEAQDRIEKFLKSTNSSVLTAFDTYPFVITEFKNKMEYSSTRNTPHQTIQTLNFDNSNLIISNYGNINITPLTKNKSSVTGYTEAQISNTTINNFYNLRFNDGSKRMITEGNISYGNTTSLNSTQTISMLNTPYFTNSIVEASTTPGDTKFVKSAYLFLNSLPLSTLYERYLNVSSGEKSDYIFASLNKFSAVHKLPFAWILKIGSVYHRYKKYIETNVDILDSVWKDFDYKKAYDPTNSNVNTTYNLKLNADAQRSSFSLDSTNYLNIGFYPEVYNAFYKIFTGYDLFTNGDVNGVTDTFYNSFKIVSTRPGTTVNGPINSYYSYISVQNDLTPFFGSENLNKKLLLPSAGYIPFQQTYYELTSSDSKTFTKSEVINQQPMYNGSVKFYWSAPTYGWFDNGQVRKPNYDEYLKFVRTEQSDKQTEFDLASQYSKIEDLFGVFTKEQLDFFESEFLEFCKENSSSSIFLNADGVDSTYSSFIEIFKKMFLINEKTPGIVDSQTLGNAQSVQISELLDKFINVNVYVKIGNPKKFDRQYFGYFSRNSQFIPTPPAFNDLGTYTQGTLPDGTITLSTSQTNNPDAWNALYTNIGFSTIEGFSYGETSYIYDFFIDNNVAFNVNNVVNLAPLIKIYATQKSLNTNYNSESFSTTINNLMSNAENKRTSIERQIIRGKLALDLTSQNPDDNEKPSTVEADTIKLDTWELFKAINDKWVSGIDFNEKLLFDEFLFFDRANRDIGDELIINVDTIRKYCNLNNSNVSVMSLVRQLMANNRMNFLVMPAYVNFYGKPSRRSTTRNQTILNNANDIFSTFTYVDYIDSAPKFLCQYVDRPSQTLSMENDPNYPFKDDSFDLGNPTNNPIRSTATINDEYKNNKAVGFVVDFGVQNQSVFKSINISQNQNVTSSEQIQVYIDMGRQGDGKQTTQQTTSLFEFYKNRSYDCEVSIIGNVMIQPTMYFVLRHIPMFNGTYMIRNVKHSITAGQFNTTFQGQRISSMINSKIRDELGAINEDFTKKLNNKIKSFVSNNTLVTYNSNSKQYLTDNESKEYIISNRIPYQGNIPLSKDDETQACFENVDTLFSPKIPNVNYIEQDIPLSTIATLLKSSVSDVNQRLYMFTMLYMMGYKVTNRGVKYKINNLYGVTVDVNWGELSKSIPGYRCLKTVENIVIPFAYFDKIEDSISFVNSYYFEKIKPYFAAKNPNTANPICANNVNYTDVSYLDCTTELFIKIFYETWWTSGNSRDEYNQSGLYNEWIVRAKEGIVKGLQPDFGLI